MKPFARRGFPDVPDRYAMFPGEGGQSGVFRKEVMEAAVHVQAPSYGLLDVISGFLR
jgi:hypothetical protein